MATSLFSIPLTLYLVFMTFMMMTTPLQQALSPRLIMLKAKRLEYNESTFYELNCSSARQSVGNGAEFIVNGRTLEHISFYNNICYNSKQKECTTDHCLCFPKDNVYIYRYENKEQTTELIIGCQMRFTDNETSNIIKVVTSVRINGSVMDLFEYDVKILKKDKEKDAGINGKKENNSTFEISLWVPVIFGILLVVSVVLIGFICQIFRPRAKSKSIGKQLPQVIPTEEVLQEDRHGALEEKCKAVFQNTIRKTIQETLSEGYKEKEVSSVFRKTIQKIIQETMIKGSVEEKINAELKNTIPKAIQDTISEGYMEKEVKEVFQETIQKIIHETINEVLPEAIKHLSERDKIRYNKLMQTSKTENRYFVRIMLVGKEFAGKTCLLRRLLKESISDVSSTDGVDIVVRRCKINIKDGKWIIGKEIDDDKVSRIKRALISNAEDRDTQHMQTDETKNIYIDLHSKISSYKKDITTDTMAILDKSQDTNESSSLLMTEDVTTDTKINLDTNKEKKEFSSLVMPEDLISHVFSRSTVNTLSNLYALCELWDFAGQKEFYATHQAFLTSSAVYLVVADMGDDISKQGLSQCFSDFQHIGEYVDFWFDSIHCHRTADKRPMHGHFNPPILLVFTGKDKYDKEADFKKREKELNDQLDQVLGLQSKYHHLHNTFYLSNTKDSDEEFETLRYAIYETARRMDNWGNAFPLKWILLEHLIEINKHDGKNFINFGDMSKLAKHPDINILEKEDLLLFLRFQHNVGNIIFFENIPDFIILRPQWLADAFRCLVSDRFDNRRLHHLEDWTLFIRQGKISDFLITKLFESKDSSQFSGQKDDLHKVMETLDILVKIENSNYYIMPSKMPSSTFDDVCRQFGILTEKCIRTSWLCFKFEFLPPSFFNHLSAWFIRNYCPSRFDSGIALYRGICMFDIDQYGFKKILVTMSTDTIALQVVSFSEQQERLGSTCSDIYSDVKQLIEDIKERYKVKISFKLHFKCSDGYYYKDTFEYEKLTSDKECFCVEHTKAHRSEQIYSTWINNEVKRIPDRAKINTRPVDHNPKNEPIKEEAFAPAQVSVKTNLPVSVNLRQQLNIKKSSNENNHITSCIKIGNTLVFTDFKNKRLIICKVDGTDKHHIPLSYSLYYITEVNSNTVAVSCIDDRTILIINISTGSVTSTINTSGYCYGISYNDNNLYVVIDQSIIHVMDLTGKVIRTIPLPSDRIYDITLDRDRLVCIDRASIYCCSLDGKLFWMFKHGKNQDLRHVTTDDEGNLYATNYNTNTVIVVSGDGKNYIEPLTESDGLDRPGAIYIDKKETILLVCNYRGGKAFLFDLKRKPT